MVFEEFLLKMICLCVLGFCKVKSKSCEVLRYKRL